MTGVIRRWPIAASSLAAVVLAACGSPSGDGAATTTQQPEGAQPAAMQEFTDCMRDQGVDLPEPSQGGPPRGGPGGGGGIDPNDKDTREAFEACQDKLPAGGPGGGPGGGPPPAGEQAPGSSAPGSSSS